MGLAAQCGAVASHDVALRNFRRDATVYFCARCGIRAWVERLRPVLCHIPFHAVACKAPRSIDTPPSMSAQARIFTLIDVCTESAVIGDERLVVICGPVALVANAVEPSRRVVAGCVVPTDHSGSKLALIFVNTPCPPVAPKPIVANADSLPFLLLACGMFMARGTDIYIFRARLSADAAG